jgi:hypothetical protein
MESPTEEPEAIVPMETISSGSPTMVNPIEEPEAIIPMETVRSGSPTMSRPTEDGEAIIPPEIVSSGSPTTTTTTVRLRRRAANRTEENGDVTNGNHRESVLVRGSRGRIGQVVCPERHAVSRAAGAPASNASTRGRVAIPSRINRSAQFRCHDRRQAAKPCD